MLNKTEVKGYRGGGGGYRGRGGGGYRGRGGGGGGGAGWSNTWRGETTEAASVWGANVTLPETEEPQSNDPVGISLTDVEAVDWFKTNNGQNYALLKELTGALISGAGGSAIVYIRRVQTDPFAPGSQMTVHIKYDSSQYHHNKAIRRVALEDLVLRHFYRIASLDPLIEVMKPSQHVVERSTVRCVEGAVEIHVRTKLPGDGRRIDGKGCASIIQRLTAAGLGINNLRSPDIFKHLDTVEDQEYIRSQLSARGLVGFIPNGAVLPRASGSSDGPLGKNAVPFKSPPEYEVSFKLPCSGKTVLGMGVRKGVTVIVGGGFHGKSTLLRALEVGVYNKIPGDGREYVVVDPTAVKIRSEDRRAITSVDISAFINNIPMGRSTKEFTTGDASGSTSQAANIVESLELGARTLLIDEDTSATNFMSRDEVMRRIVPDSLEPITPLVERIRGLYDSHGVSTVLVAGGSSAFLAVADTVMQLNSYAVQDLTPTVKALCLPMPSPPTFVGVPTYTSARAVDVATSLRSLGGNKVKCSGVPKGVRLGDEVVALDKVEQIVEAGQCNGVAMALAWMQRNIESASSVPDAVDGALKAMSANNLEVSNTAYFCARGFVTLPRRYEVGAALNRLRSLAVKSLI